MVRRGNRVGSSCGLLARVLTVVAAAAGAGWPASPARADATPQLTSAVSRRTHGTTATYDVPLPLTGAAGIECRQVGGAPTLVLQFDQPVTGGGVAVTGGSAQVAGSPAFSGNTMRVSLTGAADAQAVTVTVTNVTSAAGGTLGSAAVTVRLLEGDVNANGVVTSADINVVKAAAGTGVVDGFSYRSDLNGNNTITSSDVTVAKTRASAGTSVAGGTAANTAPTVNDVVDQAGVSGRAGPAVALAVADAESAPAALGVRATSSDPALVPASAIAVGGSGATRTLTITPAAGLTGTATITVEVGDGMTVATDTFVLTVMAAPKLFVAYLRPEGSATTPGSGFATLLLSGDEAKAELKASYSNLTTPEVAKHIHGPAGPTQNADILFDIDTAPYDEATQTYTWDIGPVGANSAAQVVAAIKSGNTYINIHSSRFPSGEIRGQFLLATGSQTFTPPPPPPALPGGPPTAQDAARFLQQATFGPTAAEISRLQSVGLDAWLAEQFATARNADVANLTNNSFETPVVGTGAFAAAPAGAAWTFEGTAGITGNGSLYTSPSAPTTAVQINAPQGAQAAYLQGTGKMRQSLAVAQPGRYMLSFLAAPRTSGGGLQPLAVKVNALPVNVLVGTAFTPTATPNPALASSDPGRYASYLTQTFDLPAGTHEVSIEGTATGADDTAMVDDVRLSSASSMYGLIRYRLSQEADSINGSGRVAEAFWRNAITAPDQLRQRVAFAYSQIFVVSYADGVINGRPQGLAHYYDMLADGAFGNFRTLLKDVTLHPVMGQYLNMRGNRKPFSPLFTAPNENYAREILQLFSVGLNQLQPDGTLKLGDDGLPLPTYDQKVIEGFANVFTGWNTVANAQAVKTPILRNVDVRQPSGAVIEVRRMVNYDDTYTPAMFVTAGNHSNSAKLLLNNVTLAANGTHTTATANAELDAALNNIFNHPNVGPFIGRQLIQRLVTSNPSPGYVYRVAQVFNNDGTGSRGNMQAVVKAVLTDYEARSTTVIANQGFGHLREPVVRAASVMRAFNPSSNSKLYKVAGTDSQLGQTPLRAPTVFNFFEPFYVHPGQLGANGLYAPEFQISTEIMAVNIPNFFQVAVYNNTSTTVPRFPGNDVGLDLTAERDMASNPAALVDHLNLVMMSGQMPQAMKDKVVSIVSGLNSGASATERLYRARLAVYMVASSSQAAVQK